MNRRSFLKAALGGVGGLMVGGIGVAMAQNGMSSAPALPGASPRNFLHPNLASASHQAVGTRIACLYDISASIDKTEHDIQLNVMADAIASEDFKNAIFYPGGPQSIAICVADFGTTGDIRIPWLDIRKGEEDKLALLAHEIRSLRRREEGMTNHAAGLSIATECIANCPWQAKRSIVDVLTDGEHNAGSIVDVHNLRDQLALRHETTINALVTLDSSSLAIETWAQNNLITPPKFLKRDGSLLDPGFVKIVATQQTDAGALVKYHDAMKIAFRRKLILEVAGIELEDLHKVTGNTITQAAYQKSAAAFRPNVF